LADSNVTAPSSKSSLRAILTSLVPLFVIAHLTHHLVTALPTPLSPYIRDEFSLSSTQVGWLLSAFSLSYGFSQLPGGWLADHIAPRILITLATCGVAGVGFLIGISHSYILLVMLLIIMGVLGGGYHPSVAPLLMASVEPKNRTQALGFHMIGGTGSHFISPLVAVALAAIWGWRGAYIGLAVPTLVFGVIFYILLGRYNSTRGSGQRRNRGATEAGVRPKPISHIVLFLIIGTVLHALNNTAISFIPLFMINRFGVDKKDAAGLLSLVYFSGFWASPLGGFLADRLGKMPVILLPSLLGAPIVFLLTKSPFGLGIYALLILLGAIGPLRNPVTEAYIVERTAPERRSTILGFYFFSNMESAGVLTPVMGYVVDRASFQFAYTGVAAILLVGSIVFLLTFWRERD